ncbi:MAG: ribonuclease III [Myxococcota bacterium]
MSADGREEPTDRPAMLASLQERIRYEFSDPDLLDRALTHSSWSNENGGLNNERLEFLGDAVVDAIVAHVLFTSFPRADEGVLSQQKHHLICTATLSSIGRELGLALILQVGAGARKKDVHQKPSKLEDATEALIAAIFLDSDFIRAAQVVQSWFEPYVDRLALERPKGRELYKNPLQRLNEVVGRPPIKSRAIPILLEHTGTAHESSFRMGWWLGGEMLGEGWGPRKKLAQRAAAEVALLRLEELLRKGWRPDPNAAPPKGVS